MSTPSPGSSARGSSPTSTSTCSAPRTTSASSTTATARPAAPTARPGSAQIEALFNDYFADQGLPVEPTPFSGRSDDGPFIADGIPAGGLFSGAEGIKTPEQVAINGGTAGEQYDPCHHEACDDITNLSTKALFELGDAAAHAVMTMARSRTGLLEDGSSRTRARVSAQRLSIGSQTAA
jgi:Zn-dependent M28 family amino/carboxypeptidase